MLVKRMLVMISTMLGFFFVGIIFPIALLASLLITNLGFI